MVEGAAPATGGVCCEAVNKRNDSLSGLAGYGATAAYDCRAYSLGTKVGKKFGKDAYAIPESVVVSVG